jgi:hypothetical protein
MRSLLFDLPLLTVVTPAAPLPPPPPPIRSLVFDVPLPGGVVCAWDKLANATLEAMRATIR